MAEANPFDEFDQGPAPAAAPASEANPFDQFDAGGAPRGTTESTLSTLDQALSRVPDETIPEVTVTAERQKPQASWAETLGAAVPSIGARIESKLAGLQEFSGKSEYADARKKFWQSMVLPRAANEAKDAGINLTEHPDVVDNAKRLGIRPDVFARDWRTYYEMSPDDREAFEKEQQAKIAEGMDSAQTGGKRRAMAAQVSEGVRPETGGAFTPKSIVFDALTGIPDLLVGFAGTVAGGPAGGIAAMGASIAPEEYSAAKNQGLDDKSATTYAVLSTVAQSAPEVPVLKIVEGGAAGKSILRRLVGDTVAGSATGKVVGTAATQGISQALIQSLQEGIDAGLIDQQTSLKDALTRIGHAGLVGTAMGVPLGGLHAAQTRAPRVQGAGKPTVLNEPGMNEHPIEAQPSSAAVPEPATPRGEAAQAIEPSGAAPKEAAPEVATRAALQALQDKTISPPQMEHLEGLGLARRTDTGVPFMLPAGRRALAAAPEDSTPVKTPVPTGEKSEEEHKPTGDTLVDRLATDDGLRAELERMKTETGWLQEGGRVLMNQQDQFTGRTGWIPKAEWWRDRPKGLTEDQVHLAVDKALKGEDLGKRERSMLEYMVGTADTNAAGSAEFADRLHQARAETETAPTDAQKAAGNYGKGELQFAPGIHFTMENPVGSTRTGEARGQKWERTMRHDYGYINRTEGADGDHVDAFLTGRPDTGKVFVVNQVAPDTGKFDEVKAILGAGSADEAREVYQANYQKGWKGLGSIAETTTEGFRNWLEKGDTTKPFEGATGTERRGLEGAERRKQVAAMSPEEMRQTLLTHELTGLPNRRAYDEAPKLSHQVAIDVDSLKWVNDTMGHAHGDELLKATAAALKEQTGHAFHISGDEFVVQAKSEAEAHDIMREVGDSLSGHTLEAHGPEGKVVELAGLGLSYGVGRDLREADRNLAAHKATREARGERAARGEKPPGAVERARSREGLEAESAVAEGGPRVEHDRVREDQASYTSTAPVSHGGGELGVGERAARGPRGRNVPAPTTLQLFASDEAPAPALARTQTHTGLIETGRFHSGIKQVKHWQDAAHIFAPLRKEPQESMMALVVDAKGRPLAVIRHQTGNQSGAGVIPHILIGSIAKVPDAAGVWFGHNHPSANPNQSDADMTITGRLHDLMRGSGIDPLGMVVVTPGGLETSFYHPGHGGENIRGKTTPAARGKRLSVPVVQRRFTRLPPTKERGIAVVSPDSSVRAVEAAGEKSGVLLLDARHNVAAVLPMHPKEMQPLRTGDKSSGMLHVLRAVEDSNASAAVTFGNGEDAHALGNLGSLLHQTGVRVLDTVLNKEGKWVAETSVSGAGLVRGAYQARREGPGPGLPRVQVERIARIAIRDSGMRAAPNFPHVEVHQDYTTLPRDLRNRIIQDRSEETTGAVYDPQTGQIHLIADNLGTPQEARETLWHEAVGHHGLRLIMDADRYAGVMDGIWNAMPDRVRQTAERNGLDVGELEQRRLAAEEVIAYAAGRHLAGGTIDKQVRPFWQRALQAVRQFFARVTGKPFTSDSDISAIIGESKRALESGSALQRMGALAQSQRAETFYSPVERAIANSKQGKASAEQWLSTIRKTPGIKPEEIEWMGLEPWLKEQKGPVTREALADYVRANKLELEETHYGSPGPQGPRGTADEQLQTRLAEQLRAMGHEVQFDPDGSLEYLGIRPENGMDVDLNARAGSLSEPENLEEVPEHLRDLVQRLDEVSHRVAMAHPLEGREGAGRPQYEEFTLPGGENYREMLIRLDRGERGKPEPLDTLPPGYEPIFDRSRPAGSQWGATLPGQVHGRFMGGGHPTREAALAEALRLVNNEREAAWAADRDKGRYRSPHWSARDILAHVRTKDRVDADGKKTLFLEELQSDWHQQGRERGYRDPARAKEVATRLAELERERDRLANDRDPVTNVMREESKWHELSRESEKLEAEKWGAREMVPAAPFKTSWPMLVMKRMIRAAAEGGYDRVAWTTGEQQAERYNLSYEIGELHIERVVPPGKTESHYWVGATYPEGGKIPGLNRLYTESGLRDLIGKEFVEKASAQELDKEHSYAGEGLKIGGEGQRGFYDDILPRETNKLIRKYGAEVGTTQIKADNAPEDVVERVAAREPDHPFVEKNRLGVHSFDITPEMREQALSQGFPMFWKKPSQQTLGLQQGQGPGWYERVRRAVDYLHSNPVTRDLRKLINPTKLSEESKRTAVLARAALGSLAHQTFETQEHLEQFSRVIDRLKPEEQLEMMDAIEHGLPQPNADLQPVADALRKQLDQWRDRVRGLGTGALDNFIENYFPHYWTQPGQAQRMVATIMGRRPLRGPASFLKMRTIPTIKEGMDAGLTPLTINPLVMTLLKVREMQRFVSGVTMMQKFKDAGLAQFLPATKPMPEGWAEIKDNIARVRQWSEEEQGFIERGRYIMPEDAARLINNHVGRSVLTDFTPTHVMRIGGNLLNAMQLGFSAFHLGFTTLDASISKNALAIEQLMHGEVGRAAASFTQGMTPAGAILNVRRGFKLMKAYADPSGATPEMARIVSALELAGGRTQMDRYYMAISGVSPFRGAGVRSLVGDVRAALKGPEPVKGVAKAVGSFPAEYALSAYRELQGMTRTMPLLQVPFEVAGRVVRASTSWIMEHLVPMQKLGVFSDLAQDYLRRNPTATSDQLARAMQSAWDSVDNRLGEMVYDNVFWNRTLKDAMHLGVRAVGWNLGTVREIGGAPIDALRAVDKLAREGKITADDIGHKIPYVLAMTMTTAALGATINYMFTGQGPQELKDYFFPRTGGTTNRGTPQRLSLPSYVKDVYEYSQHPGTTVANKLNPIFSVAADIWRNEDYFGNPISEPEASGLTQAGQRAAYAAREATPFSIQGQKQIEGSEQPGLAGTAKRVLPFIGVTPAPGYITSPDQIARRERYEAEQKYARELKYKLNKAMQSHDQGAIESLRDQYIQSQRRVKELEAEKKLDQSKAAAARRQHATSMRQQGLPHTAGLLASLPLEPDQAALDYFRNVAGAG